MTIARRPMAPAARELSAAAAFVERNFNLSRRYWGWELAFLVYAVAGALSISFIGAAAADEVVLGYALALFYVFVLRKSGSVVRTLTFFPVVLPTVAVGLLFQKMFGIAPHNGIVNAVINILGGSSQDWFGTASSAFLVLATMDIWRSMGFYAILLYTGLLDIPEELLKSARVDGASGWTLVRHIVLPLSLPVLVSSLIFSINGTLKVFDSVLALTNGGPGSGTTPLTLYMYRTAFAYGDYGYGSTIALLLTLLSLMVTLFIFRSSRRDVTAP